MYQLTQNNAVIFHSTSFDAVWKYAVKRLGDLTAEQFKSKGYAIGRAVLS